MQDQNLDMLICVVPKINPMAPTVGPALLKAHLIDAGFSCEVFDLNVKFYNYLKQFGTQDDYYFKDDSVFLAPYGNYSERFENFFAEHKSFFMEWIEFIRVKKPTYLGLSILTKYSVAVATKFSELVREHLPQIKIIWGGPTIETQIRPIIERKIFDHFISGDGEFSIVELLKGNITAPGIDSFVVNQVTDLDKVLIPNYDDINWSEYHADDFANVIYITGSRGCVRRCTFCNVYQIWPKFRQKSAQKILCEIDQMRIKYGRTTFKFTDSLINGSIKAYRELLHALVEYKKMHPDFRWISQWIIRPKEFSPEEDFKLLKASGCTWLEVGLESFVQRTRYEMGKKFSDEDVQWCFDMLQKYQIPASLLMIVGYLTETEEDHEFTLNKIRELFSNGYATNRNPEGNRLLHFCYTSTLMLMTDVPMWEMYKDKVTNYKSFLEWEYNGNTLPVRIRRFNEINELIVKLAKIPDSLPWQIARALRDQNEANLRANAVAVTHF